MPGGTCVRNTYTGRGGQQHGVGCGGGEEGVVEKRAWWRERGGEGVEVEDVVMEWRGRWESRQWRKVGERSRR